MRYEIQAAWLTRTGLLAYNKKIGYFYCDNTGVFRRFASREEGEKLEPLLPEITVNMTVTVPMKWQYLWNWKVKASRFQETHNVLGRIDKDRLALLRVVQYGETTDFEQSSNIGFVDCDEFTIYTKYSPAGEFFELLQFGRIISLQEALEGCDTEIYGESLRQEEVNAEYRLSVLKETLGWTPDLAHANL